MTAVLPASALMAAAQAACERIAPRGAEIDAARHLPADIADDLASAGLYGLLTPACYGGQEMAVAHYFELIECLARTDASSAWCTFISCTSSLIAAYLPVPQATAIFSRPDLKAAGVFAPRGQAVPQVRDGTAGYIVSGRWAWGSGTHNADIVVAGCLVTGQESAGVLSVVFQRAQVVLLDNWDSLGLRGSGSGEFEVREQWVPQSHTARLLSDTPLALPLYRFPTFGLLAISIAAVASGIAQRALAELVALAGGKVPQASSKALAQRSTVQDAVARCEATQRAARAFMMEAITSAWHSAQAGNAISVTQRRDLRLAATHLVHNSAAVVGRMYTLAGGSAVFASSPLQRCLRDVQVATQHMMVAESTWELCGRLLLGLPTSTEML